MLATTDKLLFIFNPTAGGKSSRLNELNAYIDKYLKGKCTYKVLVWEHPLEKHHIDDEILNGDHNIIIASGGDGTVNMVAQMVEKAGKTLAIIPLGSGNGLARHLHIPINMEKAVQVLLDGHTTTIDSAMVNSNNFYCTSGTGFDAEIGKLFSDSKARGFMTYVRITLAQLKSYKPQEYTIRINGDTIRRKAFLITIANAGQYGNNAWIAPQADITDNMLNVCILKPFGWWQLPELAIRLFNKSIEKSDVYESYQSHEVTLIPEHATALHFDGEPADGVTELRFTLRHHALKVLVPAG